MLRTFKPSSTFRGLAPDPFPSSTEGAHLGRHTVIFGRNGSGKSTFSEFLRLASLNESGISPLHGSYLRHETGRIQTGPVPSTVLDDVHVFNRFYVDDNLGQFLDGKGTGDPIVVLGHGNLKAGKAVRSLESEISRQESRQEWAAEQVAKEEHTAKIAVEAVKKAIIDTLAVVDGASYNTTRFTITKAEQLLQAPIDQVAVGTPLQDLITVACEPNKSPVELANPPSLDLERVYARLQELLARDVTNVAIQAFQDDHDLALWVEGGLELHSEGDVCKFCGEGVITAQLFKKYGDHFNKSLKDLQKDAATLIREVELIQRALQTESWLPSSLDMLATYEEKYREALQRWAFEANEAHSWFQKVGEVLRFITVDPLATRTLPDDLRTLPVVGELNHIAQIVLENNNACQDQSSRRKNAVTSIELKLATFERNRYSTALARADRSRRLESATKRIIRGHRSTIISKRSEMSNTSVMAGNIDRDLSIVFGHDHLRVQMTDDGKGYRITRRGETAINLSEGERHSIALVYFLRTLERAGITRNDDLVVVDDPVTSLDREALFAAYSLLTVRLKDFGQTILLTHDFELYRLSITGNKAAFEASRKKIVDGDEAEKAFPAVSFLEIFAKRRSGDVERQSVLRALPSTLLRHPSEYHYLFWCVADSLTNADESLIPLLGNAARRLLEGFISFKAPNGVSFQHKIDLTTELTVVPGGHVPASLAEVKERVVRFGHGMSHRAEPVLTNGLDFLSVRDELRMVLRFIQLCDPQHFQRVSEAVKIDVSQLGAELSQEGAAHDALPMHVFGWVPSEPRVAYVEVVHPGFTVHAVDLSTCAATAIAQAPAADERGLWLFASRTDGGLTGHVFKCSSARKYLRSNSVDEKWELAFYISGSGAEKWQGQHQHFLETSIRLSPDGFGISAVDEPPRGALPSDQGQTGELCEAILTSLQFALPSLTAMLERGSAERLTDNNSIAEP